MAAVSMSMGGPAGGFGLGDIMGGHNTVGIRRFEGGDVDVHARVIGWRVVLSHANRP